MAENDAEWVPGRVGEDPEAGLAFTVDTSGAQGEQFLLGPVGVAHADVKMHLLRMRRIRPARRNPVGDLLEGELPQAGPGTGNQPAAEVLVDPHPQHLAVEPREEARVRAVDHCLFEASDHTGSMSACQRDRFLHQGDRHAGPLGAACADNRTRRDAA